MNILETLKKDGIGLKMNGTKFVFDLNGKIVELEKETIENLLYSTLLNQLKMLSENIKK